MDRCRVTQCYRKGSEGPEREDCRKLGGTGAGWSCRYRQEPELRALKTRDPEAAWLGWTPPPPGLTCPALPLRPAVPGPWGPVGLRKCHSWPGSTPSLRHVLLSAPRALPRAPPGLLGAVPVSCLALGLQLGLCLLCHSS